MMKKQILILSFLVLAVMAGITKSYGQNLAPRSVVCLPADALHPIAGTEYTYQIDIPVTPNPGDAWTAGSLEYLWFVTQLDLNAGTLDDLFIENGVLRAADDDGTGNGTFIAAQSGDLAAASTDAAVGADNVMQLTWKNIEYDETKPIFIVVSVTGNNGVCDPNNMKVFKIEPLIAFTLDIDNLQADATQHTPTAYGDLYEQCVSDIVSARWTTSGVVYDFGVNYLYYEVVAANWSDQWSLGVQLTGVDPLETITVEWSKDKTFPAATSYAMTTTSTHTATTDVLQYTTTDNVTATASTGQVGATGESIFIRVTLDHSVSAATSYQGLEDQNIALAVDGMTNWDATLNSGAGDWTIGDVHYDNGPAGAEPCAELVEDGYTNDKALQDVKARPTIENNTTTMPAPGLQPVVTPNP